MTKKGNYAFITFLTSTSYLPGALLLHHSIKKHSSYPLLVALTPNLADTPTHHTLTTAGIEVRIIPFLRPPQKVSVVAERFEDTWTKLRVFEFEEFERVALIDGDMMLMRNMDEVFEVLDGKEEGAWIAANHACVCNLDLSSWAPKDWTRENCAYTPLSHPDALTNPTPVTPTSRRTHTLLNSGLVILTPSKTTAAAMYTYLSTSLLISTFSFPDQDFLAAYFHNHWLPLGWQYNAIKTARYWHTNIWRDEEVRNLHYICDKPWKRRRVVVESGPGMGDDSETHGWWWREWDGMVGGWKEEGVMGEELLGFVEGLVDVEDKKTKPKADTSKVDGVEVTA